MCPPKKARCSVLNKYDHSSKLNTREKKTICPLKALVSTAKINRFSLFFYADLSELQDAKFLLYSHSSCNKIKLENVILISSLLRERKTKSLQQRDKARASESGQESENGWQGERKLNWTNIKTCKAAREQTNKNTQVQFPFARHAFAY